MNKRIANKKKKKKGGITNKKIKRIKPRGASKTKAKKNKKKDEPPKYEGLLSDHHTPFPTGKVTRLNKVARDLNVEIKTVVEYLEKNGFEVYGGGSPNTKIGSAEIEAINGNIYKLDTSYVCDYTVKLIEDLKLDYTLIFSISPEQFELLVASLLEKSGFTVKLNGNTNTKDGGIDIIAYRRDIILTVIAIQVKHKRTNTKKVTAGEVRDLKGAMSINDYFSAGMLVTNTDFTADARWIEEQINTKMELKNSNDIQSWLKNNFATQKELILDVDLAKDVSFKY